MSNHDPNHMADHDYDGITELDSLLPKWWLWLFWGCIVFGIIYYIYFEIAKVGPGSGKEYAMEMEAARKAEAALMANAPPVNLEEPSKDKVILAKGQAIFMANCIPCHGMQAQGIIGPNLTDDFWIHGGKFANIKTTITEGVPAKGMISWKLTMKEPDIHAVASYVWSIHGTDVSKAVPPPKAPEPEAKEEKRTS